MPQPVPKSQSDCFYKPKILLEKPKLAAGIGLVAAEWGALENHLLEVSTFNVFSWEKEGQAEAEITELVLSKIDSLHTRLAILERIVEDRLPDDLLKRWNKNIAPEIRCRAKERNKIVHGHWHGSTYFPDDLILLKSGGSPMRYTHADFIQAADRIIETSNLMMSFWMGCRERLYPLTIPKFPPQPPEPGDG